jgi:hypothetical protein
MLNLPAFGIPADAAEAYIEFLAAAIADGGDASGTRNP